MPLRPNSGRCPREAVGKRVRVVLAGSTGIHSGHYEGKWPDGGWWIFDGDIWPSYPVLARQALSAHASQEPNNGGDE